MAKTESVNYAAERVQLATQPRAFVRFFHVKLYGDSTDYAFSRDFATGSDILSPSVPKYAYIRRVQGNTQTVEPELGRSSSGAFAVELVDVGGEVLRYLSTPALTLNGAHTDAVTTITVNESTAGMPTLGTAEITTSGVKERVRYAGKTTFTLTGCTRGVDGTTAVAHSSGDACTNGEQIRAGQRMELWLGYAPIVEADYMRLFKMEIGDVDMAADGVTFIVKVADVLRSLRRTLFLLATTDAPVTKTGNPLTLLLNWITSTGAGTNGAYDTETANNGLAIPQGLIDLTGIAALRDRAFPSYSFSFSLTTPMNGQALLEDETCKVLNCYPVVTQTGQLTLKQYAPSVYSLGATSRRSAAVATG